MPSGPSQSSSKSSTGTVRQGGYVVKGTTKVQSTRFTIEDGRVSGVSMVGVELG